MTSEEIKTGFTSLLTETNKLPHNEGVFILCSLFGYLELKIKEKLAAGEEAPVKRHRGPNKAKTPQAQELDLKAGE